MQQQISLNLKNIILCILFPVNCGNKSNWNCPNNICLHLVSKLRNEGVSF